MGGNDEFDNAFLATNGGARVGESATTTTAAGGGDAVGAFGGGFGGGGPNAFGMMMQAHRNLQSDQQSSKRKMQINTQKQHKQQRQYAVGQKKAPMKKNVGSSSSLPVSNGGDSQTARATTPRMTPTGLTTMLETQAFQRSHFERFSADQMMMMNSPTMNSPPPTTMTAYAGGYAFDAGEDVVVFDAEALAALASEEEKNKSELLQKAKTMNEKMKRCRKRDIILEEDAKTVISLEGAAGYVGEEHLGEEQEYIDLTIEGDPQITAEMKRLRIESSNQAGTSLPTPIAEGNDAVAVLTATCEVLPTQFTERVTNWLSEKCQGTKPLFRLKDNSCASTIFKYDLNDRGKDAVLEQATPEVLERIKSECRAGTAGVQKSVHLAFAPLVPEGGSQYRNRSDDPLLKSPTARGLEALHKKFWEVYDFKCSPETKFLYVVTGNVWMEASYVRIGKDQQEGDRVPAKVHERFNAEGDENFGNLPPSLWVPCFAKIYAILAEITTSVRVKGGGNLKNFIFAIDTAKGAKALFNAAKSFFNVSDAYFLELFPVYGTGVHPSLIVRKWCLWLYAARLLAMCAYYRTGEILGGQTIPQASSYPEPGRGGMRMQIPLLSNDDKYLTNDEKLRLFQRILFYLVVGGASADGKTNALKPLWITADIQSLAERTEIRPTFLQKNEIMHSFTSRPGLRLSYGSVFVHNKGWKKVDFSEFTTNTGKDANSLQSEHQLAYFFKMNPTLMNPTLTPQEEENIKRCDLLYFPFPLNQEVNARRISPQVRLTEAIELNRENIYAKPMEDENRYVDENLDEILEKVKRSGQPHPIRKRWSDLENFLMKKSGTKACRDMARNEVDWDTMRRECTSLACTWTLNKPKNRGIEQRITLYQMNEAGVWSKAEESGPAIAARLKDLYPKKKKMMASSSKSSQVKRVTISSLSLSQAIELNRENIYAKPMEDENRYVDENLDEILEKAKRSGQPQPIRKRWSDLEKFLKVGQTTTAGKDMARNEVDWETMRRECTSLACKWTLNSRGSQNISLYEKSKAIWSRAGTTGPDITNRLKALYPKNRTDEEEKMALDSD